MNIINWLKKDWFILLLDICIIMLIFVEEINLRTVLLISYTAIISIDHYIRFKRFNNEDN